MGKIGSVRNEDKIVSAIKKCVYLEKLYRKIVFCVCLKHTFLKRNELFFV